MNDAASTESPAKAPATPSDLLDNLRELGQALPVSSQPNAHDSGPLLAGVVFYLATGSLVPPRVELPDQAAERAELAEQTRVNEAEAKVAELERRLAAADAGPAAVAPTPTAAVPTPTEPVAEVPVPPVPTGPVEPATGAAINAEPAKPSEAEMLEAWTREQAARTAAEGSGA